MANQGKRMVQEDELKYLQTLKKEHEDPTAPWGGGSTYEAGKNIDITEGVISVDDDISVKSIEVVNKSKGIDIYSGVVDSSSAKLGFTLYNNEQGNTSSAKEVGFLEANTNNKQTVLGYYNINYGSERYRDWDLGFKYYGYVTDGQTSKLNNFTLFVPNQMTSSGDTTHYMPVKFTIGSGTSYEADNTGIVTLPSYPTVPTNISSFNNDAGYITSSALTGYATESWVTNQGYSTFSGSYNDLTNKPTIPTDTSDLTNNAGFITASVNNLSNYYDKTYIDNTVGNIETLLAAI